MYRRLSVVAFTVVLIVLGMSQLSAAGEVTLGSLASAISKVIQKQNEFESRLVAVEKELNIITATPTVTSTPVDTATPTPIVTETPASSSTAAVTKTPTPTRTSRPTRTPSPTISPTPSLPSVDFSELPDEYEKNKIRFKTSFVDQVVYVRGRVHNLSERGEGFQIEFDGPKLDLICRLPASSRLDVLNVSIGDTVVVYGFAELDTNWIGDDDLLIKECSVASSPNSETVRPTARAIRRPTSTRRPTLAPTRRPTSTRRPTLAPTRRPTSTRRPTLAPTRRPTSTRRPTAAPTRRPTSTRRPTIAVATPSFTVARDTVNVRAGPGTSYAILGKVRRGQTFTPNGRNRDGDWLRFRWSRTYGWVFAQLMTVSNAERIPVVSVPPPPTSTPARAQPPPRPTPQPQVRCPSNCTQAHSMGMSNMGTGHACYLPKFDRDRDGIACER